MMSSALRILLLSHAMNNPDAGASRVYHMLGDALAERGHAVDLYHLDDMGLPDNPFLAKLILRPGYPHLVSRFASRLDLDAYDVVMTSNGMALPLFRRLAKRRQRPVLVSHYHGASLYDYVGCMNEHLLGHIRISNRYRFITCPMQIRWDDQAARCSDLAIAQNLRDLAWLRPRLSTNAQCELIPPAVLPEILDASFEAPPIAERNPFEMLFFGSWGARKGSYYVPGAFRLIREQLPNMRLTIWGGGKEVGSVLSEFEDRDRTNVTVAPGMIPRAELIERYGDFSIFLFPSLSEGFGLELLEACCFGLAPVTTNLGFGGD
jgi:glycosyltransferase involved in cell wall biosynthesis